MRWLRRSKAAVPGVETPLADDLDALLRAGYEREARADPAGAERLYRQVLEREPGHADACYFLGRIAAWDRRYDEATALFQAAIESEPGEAMYRLALGGAFLDTRQFEEALEQFDVALGLLPGCGGEVQVNRAAALIELGRRDEALPELEKLQELLPEASQVFFNLGGIYKEYGRIGEAISAYRRALSLAPDNSSLYSNLLLVMNYSDALSAADIYPEHLRYGERFSRRYVPPLPDARWPRRLRVGYLSPDLYGHVVTYFLEPLLANHDRSKFEVHGYHTHSIKDRVTERLRSLVEQWHDCEDLSDAQLAERIREDRIDILVDLAGHTGRNRLPAFALKPAPLQATYLGYPNTTGLGAVDYHITDAYADPPESDRFSVEQPLRLPGTYFCYRPFPGAPEITPPPLESRGYATFGCFNNFSKISGTFLEAVAAVLQAVPQSRFILKCRPLGIAAVKQSVQDVFSRAGIDPERLELRGWETRYSNHLSIYGEIDVALDCFPYNGATTTCEALWMGVPVVTLVADRHAGRVGLSLLSALGLDDLVARDASQYVGICAGLVADRPRLASLRAGLRERMRASRLMDEQGFVRTLESRYIEAWQNLLRQGRAGEAWPRSPGELVDRAHALRQSGQAAESAEACKKALQQDPAHEQALAMLWDLGFELGTPGLSLDFIAKALVQDGGRAQLHYMLGCVLQAQGKSGDAITAFDRAVELDPNHAKAHSNLGWALELAGRIDLAAQCYLNAVQADPGLAQPLYNLGNALKQLGDLQEAARRMTQALEKEPQHADWLCNLASIQFRRLELDEAVDSLRRALEIDPGDHRAYSQLAMALVILGRVEEALVALDKALGIKPQSPEIESFVLLALHYREAQSEEALFARHRAWAEKYAGRAPRMTGHRRRRLEPARLNIGYVSPDFMRHPVVSFIEPVLDSHNREAFSVFCYSAARNADEVTRRLRGKCDEWREIDGRPDVDVADRMRADGIDILIDLAGHTQGGRPLLFARKTAPVQVTWLGYPNTTGLDAMDYRLTDAICDPEGSDDHCTEALVRLPYGFLCYLPPEEAPEVDGLPQERTGRVTFGCFNNLAKITPEMIALWARLLQAVPDSRLLFKTHGLAAQSARSALITGFEAHGIVPERVQCLPYEWAFQRHLARYGEIDVALDVVPYNGTTTTCEALWMGVPVVVLAGKSHVARVGASILHHAGLAELVASSSDDYVEIARALACDAERLRALRSGMRGRLKESRLLDRRRFTATLENEFRRMWAAQAAAR